MLYVANAFFFFGGFFFGIGMTRMFLYDPLLKRFNAYRIESLQRRADELGKKMDINK